MDYNNDDEDGPVVRRAKSVYLETGLVLVGTALTVVTTVVMPDDQHFHVTGALLIVTGSYTVVARKLPASWWYSVASALLGAVGVAYFIYAFVTRLPGIRHFFIVFFVEVAMMFSLFFVAFRQIRQIIIYNIGVHRCRIRHKMVKPSDPELVKLGPKLVEVMDMATTPTLPSTITERKDNDDDDINRSEPCISSNSSVTTPCKHKKTQSLEQL